MLGILQLCLGFDPGSLERQRAQIAELAMRSLRVVVVPERAEPNACLGQRGKDMQVQAFVAHGSIEPLFLPILPGLARLDVQRLDAARCQPGLHCNRNELCTIVAA